jgi:signal transduction histidine kinase/HAMP domain-containing protein/ActR/RegA family two-component response regulator
MRTNGHPARAHARSAKRPPKKPNGLRDENDLREILEVLEAVRSGDFGARAEVSSTDGTARRIARELNDLVDRLQTVGAEIMRVAREVGTEGKLGAIAEVQGAAGTWKDLTHNVNVLASNLTNQVRNIALVTTAVASGDLSQKITVEARGEVLELKETVNRMVDQLRALAAEVTRVAREVGTEGKLGGQAQVPGVAGTWKDLTDNVNAMSSNLTTQVRGITKVVTAVAQGDLGPKLALGARGEMALLADTINDMTTTLHVFAQQVTTVAREVGVEGKLGGQAKVPGASGTWRALIEAVNQLASNLTTQVRAIAGVATAVTAGDLTRAITVEAKGEVLQLKDSVNDMIENLRDSTQANTEQDWLKTNLAKFSGMLQGQRSIGSLARLIMSELTPLVSAQQGLLYVLETDEDTPVLQLLSSYAFESRKQLANRFVLGEGLVGQCALEKKTILITDVPADYLAIRSGLGKAAPANVIVLPVLFEGQLKAVIELASFQHFTPIHINFLEQLVSSIGVVFNMIGASMRTEELLQELQRSNSELGNRSRELEEKASELEIKNREIARASASLEEKARELARASKYKSDFLANMSHELRTPLNSLLILAKLLADNEEKTLTSQQVDYARTICSSGRDLLALINEILDLSKVESGKVEVKAQDMMVADLKDFCARSFDKVAEQKGLSFRIDVKSDAPKAIHTDPLRLQQILKNLLSNAFKFTQTGGVTLEIGRAPRTTPFQTESLAGDDVVAFTVTDTGIGIPEDKQRIVFEAFHQADASTSRTYGGTGLGLAISRELARLLGGEIALRSTPGRGSTFTLYVPASFSPPNPPVSIRRETPSVLPPPLPASFIGRKVLVVDDDVRNAYAIRSLLERRGMSVLLAESARASLDALQKNPDVDVVLMDIMMPEVDGYDATRNIRAMEKFAKLPIIALTSKAMVGDREKVLEAGCNDFVPKPVETDQLLAVMGRLLETPKAHAAMPALAGAALSSKEARHGADG